MPNDDRIPIGSIELDHAFDLLQIDPKRSLEICEEYVSNHPGDANGYNSRASALRALGENARALADLDKAIELAPDSGRYSARGDFYRVIGEYQRGIDDLSRARELDEEEWKYSLDPIMRADCYARLGRLDEALADCAHIPDDWWMPAFNGFPGGNKEEIIEEIKRRALSAREKKGSGSR